jgi:hypothetical protein
MLTIIYGTEANQDGYYYKSEDMFSTVKNDKKTYMVYQGNQLIYKRPEL